MDSCTIRHYFQDASTSWKKTATQLHLQHDIIVFITQSPQQIIVLTTIRRSCMVGDFKEMHHFFSTRLNSPHLYGTLWHLFASLAYSWACQRNHSESTWSWHHSSLKHILNPPTFAVLLYVQPIYAIIPLSSDLVYRLRLRFMFINKISISQTCLYTIKLPDFYNNQSLQRALGDSLA